MVMQIITPLVNVSYIPVIRPKNAILHPGSSSFKHFLFEVLHPFVYKIITIKD
jgi:hypothetical protein